MVTRGASSTRAALVAAALLVGCDRVERVSGGEPPAPAPDPILVAPTGPRVEACGPVVLGAARPSTVYMGLFQVGADIPTGFWVPETTGCMTRVEPIRQSVAPFFLDKSEVSKRCYAACVAEQRCRPMLADPMDPDTTDPNDPSRADEPAGGVNHYQAAEFCHWRGGRLPLRTELAYALNGEAARAGPPALVERAVDCFFRREGAEDCADLTAAGLLGHRQSPQRNPRLSALTPLPGDVGPGGVVGLFGGVGEWAGGRDSCYYSYDGQPAQVGDVSVRPVFWPVAELIQEPLFPGEFGTSGDIEWTH